MCINTCNHHRSQDRKLKYSLLPLRRQPPNPTPAAITFLSVQVRFTCFRSSDKWNHVVSTLTCLAALAQPNVLEIHSYCVRQQIFIYKYTSSLCRHMFLIFLRFILKRWIDGLYGEFIFIRNTKLYSKIFMPFHTPITNVWHLQIYILLSLGNISLFIWTLLVGVEWYLILV